jgi:hypothetical protein
MEFKALLINEGTKTQEFIWLDHDCNCWVTGECPDLFANTATLDKIKEFHPNYDYTGITMVTVKLEIVK